MNAGVVIYITYILHSEECNNICQVKSDNTDPIKDRNILYTQVSKNEMLQPMGTECLLQYTEHSLKTQLRVKGAAWEELLRIYSPLLAGGVL